MISLFCRESGSMSGSDEGVPLGAPTVAMIATCCWCTGGGGNVGTLLEALVMVAIMVCCWHTFGSAGGDSDNGALLVHCWRCQWWWRSWHIVGGTGGGSNSGAL